MAKIFESSTDEVRDIFDDRDDWGPENDLFAESGININGFPRNGNFRNFHFRRQADLFGDCCDSSV